VRRKPESLRLSVVFRRLLHSCGFCERGSGVRGEGAVFEPPCPAQSWIELRLAGAFTTGSRQGEQGELGALH
jgi:hypothetical protein